VYEIPVSNPRGFTDLQTAFLNVGEIRNNTFTVTSLREERDGAFQFSVKNIGTKTSERWTYTVELPDGDSYTSSSQAPLKPNERAVITIGFAVPGISVHTFEVDVDVDDDRNRNNNSFERRVSVQR
jgi:subtilase family serine protease